MDELDFSHDSLERDCDERYEYEAYDEAYDDTVTWDLAGPSEEEY